MTGQLFFQQSTKPTKTLRPIIEKLIAEYDFSLTDRDFMSYADNHMK